MRIDLVAGHIAGHVASRADGRLVRILFVGAAVVAAAASATPGDRARNGCPEGEVCSPDTPMGLVFEGPPLAVFPTANLHPVASGGRQTVWLIDNATHDPLALPFSAEVTAAAHGVLSTGTDTVVVAASEVGSGKLRILDPDGALYDRVDLFSRDIDRIEVTPTFAAAWPRSTGDSWAALAGGQAELAINLRAADDQWLVDETLTVTGPFAMTRSSWDAVVVTVPSGNPSFDLRVDAGLVSNATVTVPVVDTITTVDGPARRTMAAGTETSVCFAALSGTRVVIGAPWAYQASGPYRALDEQLYPGCLGVLLTGAGTVTITATVPGASATAVIDVTDTMPRTRLPDPPRLPATAGDRAAAAEAALDQLAE